MQERRKAVEKTSHRLGLSTLLRFFRNCRILAATVTARVAWGRKVEHPPEVGRW